MCSSENIVKDGKRQYATRVCNVCGCRQYANNFARHLRTKKHQEVDYANNQKFEITRVEPQEKKNNSNVLILK